MLIAMFLRDNMVIFFEKYDDWDFFKAIYNNII